MKRGSVLGLVGVLIAAVLGGCGTASEVEAASSMQSKQAVSAAPMADAAPTDGTPIEGAKNKNLFRDNAGRGSTTKSVSPGRAEGPIAPQVSTPTVLQQRDVVRKAELTVRVKNVEKSEKEVGKIVGAVGGYVESANSTDLAGDKPKIAIQLRIPSTTFDDTLAKLEALGTRMSKSVSSEDVTAQLVDLDARLRNMHAQEESVRNMVKQTQNMNALLDLQQRLTEIRTQIESVTAQRKALGGLASLSTVTVYLEQSADPTAPPTDPTWLSQTWGEAIGSLASTGRVLMIMAVWILTFTPIWVPAAWFARRAYLASKKAA